MAAMYLFSENMEQMRYILMAKLLVIAAFL
jgi:hypothetical protein